LDGSQFEFEDVALCEEQLQRHVSDTTDRIQDNGLLGIC
jgi:hypothetical protein